MANETMPDSGYFWLIRTGQKGEREEQSLREGVVLPGMDYGEDVNRCSGFEEIKKAMRKHRPEMKKGAIPVQAAQVSKFQSAMRKGDRVLMPSKLSPGKINTGIVSGDYCYRPEQADPECRHAVPVNWDDMKIHRDDFGIDLQNLICSPQTMLRISKNEAGKRAESVIAGKGDFLYDRFSRPSRHENSESDFDWKPFFEELATKLLEYRGDRTQLLSLLKEAAELSERPTNFKHLFHWGAGETREEARDIDPFTVIGAINRQITWNNKKAICHGFKEVFGLETAVPTSFCAVPQLNNMSSRFEGRQEDIENSGFHESLWELLSRAIDFSENEEDDDKRARFIESFDEVTKGRSNIRLTMGLFWARPDSFLSLDNFNLKLLASEKGFGNPIETKVENGKEYLELIDRVKIWLADSTIEPKNLAGFSLAAFEANLDEPEIEIDPTPEPVVPDKSKFTIASIVGADCFIEEAELQKMIIRWEEKKNIILQGPPGTGKTWLARKLAQALCGTDSEETVTAVQFHPSTSYEDFIQGFRPSGEGKLRLEEGPFLKAVRSAKEDETNKHVIVIEEINRGNPAQIFGEMLTLLEADKRGPGNELVTLYGTDEDKLFLPKNLYVIGTMNQADRSLALVDMALRRRFSFITLAPQLGRKWREFCVTKRNRDPETLELIADRLTRLNQFICDDPTLGTAYEIGHSFVTPLKSHKEPSQEATLRWFESVITTDIQPLLEEYWFDDKESLNEALGILHGHA